MAFNILILGASYGSLLATKLVMAGHDVTLVCRAETADLINREGTFTRLKLKDEDSHRTIASSGQPGRLAALSPEKVDPAGYDLVGLAMQEPQYGVPSIFALMRRIAEAGTPCLSIMNMPPLAYLRRIAGLEASGLAAAYSCPAVWDGFDPDRVTLCSPDPQAFRPPEEKPNVLHVGLPTNFKAAPFRDPAHEAMMQTLENDIAAVRLDGKDVPVKLKRFPSLFVPFAKWSMLLTGNYRCVLIDGVQPIRDAVHADQEISARIYRTVDDLVHRLGAENGDLVPFEKYASAAKSLLKPSSAARAIDAGIGEIERVDRLVQLIGRQFGVRDPAIDAIVAVVDSRLARNRALAA